jgi:hypothetical protein
MDVLQTGDEASGAEAGLINGASELPGHVHARELSVSGGGANGSHWLLAGGEMSCASPSVVFDRCS